TPIGPNDQEKDINNDFDQSTNIQKPTTPMKYSFSEPHRSNSNASMHSSVSSVIELNNENINKQY
ncbi:unnamed protein product, partial [Rotaria sp. Silwood1]